LKKFKYQFELWYSSQYVSDVRT